MNIKPILRYQLRYYLHIFSIVYGTVYGLMILTIIFEHTQRGVDGSSSGMEFTTMVAMFIIGIVLFKSSFRFFSSYGVSRKRLFLGMTASMGITSAATSLLDMINFAVFSQFMNCSTFYQALSNNISGHSSSPFLAISSFSLGNAGHIVLHVPALGMLLSNWLWCFLTDLALGMLGFLIAVLYYRMSKTLKIIVSVGVPAFFFVFIPLLDTHITGGRIGAALFACFTKWTFWGLNPGSDLISRLPLLVLLVGATFALFRKAEVTA